MDEKSCEEMYKRADWAGGYLYKWTKLTFSLQSLLS
jgi:hypothetical protein